MPRTKSKAASSRGQNEDSKSVTSHKSGSRAGSQRGAAKGGRKGAKSRQSGVSERSASKSRTIKEEPNSSQNEVKAPANVDPARVAPPRPGMVPQKLEQSSEMMKRSSSSAYPPQNGPKQINKRFPPQVTGGMPNQTVQKIPSNIPPQITAADANRAHANMPSDTELVEAKISGENVKASAKTIDYLRRFEGFLNKPPTEKLNFLNEKYFKSIAKDSGIFKTNRGKEVKCPICMKNMTNPQEMEKHFQKAHKEMVQLGMEYFNGEFKVSNKIANVVAMFCFTYSSTIPGVVTVAKDRLNGKEPKFFDLDKQDAKDADEEES
jgi:hypothetical protein